MKFEFTNTSNDSKLQTINTSKILDRRFKVTFFKESGKYYTSEEFKIISDFTLDLDSSRVMNDLMNQIEEFVTEYPSYRGMTAVVEFQSNDNEGYPMMIPANRRA